MVPLWTAKHTYHATKGILNFPQICYLCHYTILIFSMTSNDTHARQMGWGFWKRFLSFVHPSRNEDRSNARSLDYLYKYKELPNDSSFRVLELLPGELDESISCRLHVADWTNPPDYEAISYAWGNSSDTFPANCDGKLLDISPNLRDGLLQMRLSDHSRFLWADAIW